MNYQEILEEEQEAVELLSEKAANLYKRIWDAKLNLWRYEHRDAFKLTPNDKYVVHHIDGDHTNNDPSNLQKVTRAEHARLEKPALKHEKCKICGEKHYGKGYCAKHYWLYVTKPRKKKKSG